MYSVKIVSILQRSDVRRVTHLFVKSAASKLTEISNVIKRFDDIPDFFSQSYGTICFCWFPFIINFYLFVYIKVSYHVA